MDDPTDSSPDADWYVQAWMKRAGKRQAALVNELGWEKSRAHNVWHSKQMYRREEVNQIAAWLGILPHELLMPPELALAYRQLRAVAESIVSAPDTPAFEPPPDWARIAPAKKAG